MLTGNGLARRVHIALIALLVVGVAGSFWMSLRARDAARDRVVEQAEDLVDSSLTLVFDPEDLQRDASPERIRELSRAIDDVVFDPSDFETVTLFAASGEILFSTDDGNIGQRFAGERARIRAAFNGAPQARLEDNTLFVTVGLRFPSGVGSTAAVELSHPADDIAGAAGPWRTNMFFLGGALDPRRARCRCTEPPGSRRARPRPQTTCRRDPGPSARAGEAADPGTAAGDEGRGGGSPARRDPRAGGRTARHPAAGSVPSHARRAPDGAEDASRPAGRR